MATDLTKKEIYVVFDPTTGKPRSIHIVGLTSTIPTEAIKVTSEQYTRLIEDSNWVYDWDTEKLVYVKVNKKLNLDELRIACCKKVNSRVEAEIIDGFIIRIDGKQAKFTCTLEDQQNITTLHGVAATASSDSEFNVRCYVDAEYDKTTLAVSRDAVLNIYSAMHDHIQACRERGWSRKDYINAGERTLPELETYINKI